MTKNCDEGKGPIITNKDVKGPFILYINSVTRLQESEALTFI